nr:hypothetical protein [Leclercia sp. 119287]
MSNINKQALLIENGQLVADTLRHLANNEIDSDYFAIVSESENGTEIEQELAITDYAMQAAGTVGELVKALESAQELVELQRFKLERQAEDLHQAKSLESIHRDKRFEVEREFSSYKDNAERNTSRLAQEVCRLEDELESAEKELSSCKNLLDKIKSNSCHVDTSAGAFIPNSLDAWGRPVPQYLPYDFSGNPGASATQYCNGWNDAGGYWLNHITYLQECIRAAGIITRVGE